MTSNGYAVTCRIGDAMMVPVPADGDGIGTVGVGALQTRRWATGRGVRPGGQPVVNQWDC